MDIENRIDCPMRNAENGNCLCAGGFCTSLSDEICVALHNAYNHGYNDAIDYVIDILINPYN